MRCVNEVRGAQILQVVDDVVDPGEAVDEGAVFRLREQADARRGPQGPELHAVVHVEELQRLLGGGDAGQRGGLWGTAESRRERAPASSPVGHVLAGGRL